jgi:hypothetical protein
MPIGDCVLRMPVLKRIIKTFPGRMQVVETAIDNADRYYRVVGSGIDGVSSVEQSRAFKAVAQSWLAKQEV